MHTVNAPELLRYWPERWGTHQLGFTGYPVFTPLGSLKGPTPQARAACLEKLTAFRPRVCAAHNVTISGGARRIQPWTNSGTPPDLHDTLLLSTNLMGAAFYHTTYYLPAVKHYQWLAMDL